MANFLGNLRKRAVFPALLGVISFLLFLAFQAQGITGGDSGDLVTAAATFGVPHPPGYPLYTFFGWIASRLPFFTPAWRVGLLSSLPHAAVIALVYMLVSSLTKQKFIGLFSALLLLGNYLFFFYSVTPEVFGLFDLFVIVFVYLLIRRRSLSLIAFVFGLALTHHHVIVFLVPAAIYWLWGNRLRVSALFWFLAGLVPYAYVFVAARGHSIINWDRPDNLAGFIRLITRADYGTFISSGYFGTQLVTRLLQLQAYGQFVLMDFSWIGIALMLLGLFYLWRSNKRLLTFFVLALLFLGPAFFFYASFPLANRFTLGTYERFLLPSYVLLSVLAGFGLAQTASLVRSFMRSIRLTRLVPLVLSLGFVVILLYPVSQLAVTIWRFWGLAKDRTADHVGMDVLSPLPPQSILFLGRDTTLFSTQYVRYALGFRPDVIAIHASLLGSPDYRITLRALFPSLSFPASDNAAVDLMRNQYGKVRIFSTSPIAMGIGWYWVPYGLTYELVDEKRLPTVRAMYEENVAIWKMLHDPAAGILSRYDHLMLSDVRDVYAAGRIALGTALLRAGMFPEADGEFRAAIWVAGDMELASAYTYAGLSQLFQKQCKQALDAFAAAKTASVVPDSYLTLYEGVTYRDCAGDAERAKTLLDAFDKLRKQEETPLSK